MTESQGPQGQQGQQGAPGWPPSGGQEWPAPGVPYDAAAAGGPYQSPAPPPPGYPPAPPGYPPASGYPPPPPGTPYGYGPPGQPYAAPPGRDGLATAALIFGILPIFAGVLGIVFGIRALRRIKRSGRRGRGFAIAGIVLGSLWLVGALVAAAMSADPPRRDRGGAAVTSGTVSLEDLHVGDCTKGSPTGAHITTVDLVPCTQPHATEVYATFDVAGGTAYPGRAEVDRLVLGRCRKDLPTYVGVSGGAATGYDIVYLKPTEASWGRDQRGAACLLHDPTGKPLTGSARGTGPLR